MSGGNGNGGPPDIFELLAHQQPRPRPPAAAVLEAQRLYELEVYAVHLALVEVGVAGTHDLAFACSIVQLNRGCQRNPVELAQLVVRLAEIANAARLSAATPTGEPR